MIAISQADRERIRKKLQEADDWLETPAGQEAMAEAEREEAHAYEDNWKWRATI